ncbi:MAG: fasciclin domain-containing protein, partial [Rhodothermales bacterium]|nr:fasciclin domain-containing protein [Rhodothermales bacterium]
NNAIQIMAAVALIFAAPVFAGCDSDSASDPDPLPSIFETAQEAGFSTLVAAVEAADLASVLDENGPFTVFAPTNAAFDALPEGTVAELLKPENKGTLAGILTYHVVEGRVTSDQVVNLTSAKTVQGQEISISVQDRNVFVNGAQVTSVDIEAANGIIHVIDAVLLPPSE